MPRSCARVGPSSCDRRLRPCRPVLMRPPLAPVSARPHATAACTRKRTSIPCPLPPPGKTFPLPQRGAACAGRSFSPGLSFPRRGGLPKARRKDRRACMSIYGSPASSVLRSDIHYHPPLPRHAANAGTSSLQKSGASRAPHAAAPSRPFFAVFCRPFALFHCRRRTTAGTNFIKNNHRLILA